MYDNTLSTKDFLYIVYLKIEIKMKYIIELMENGLSSTSHLIEFYETKSKMIEVFNVLSLNSSDKDLIKTYDYLSLLIASDDINNYNIVIDYCKKIRSDYGSECSTTSTKVCEASTSNLSVKQIRC